MTSGLQVTDLGVQIGDQTLVDKVSFTIAPGQICGLAGESGSGKSLTALGIMGLLPDGARRTGTAHLDDLSLFALDEKEMCAVRGQRIAMIFQEPMTALNPVRSIGDQVAETLLVHSAASKEEAYDIAAEKLNRVGLPASRAGLQRYPHELSGGQRQRVMIAQAIALRPDLLIADEPTTALDVTTQASILELLGELVSEDGMSMLLITHDLAVLAGVSTNINIMQNGVIVESDATETLFRHHRHPYTKKLFAASRHIPRQIALPSNAERLLDVSNLSVGYAGQRGLFTRQGPDLTAVNDVSFSIDRGESLGLVGESGCGKSTLARTILGLQALRSGQISLLGKSVGSGQHVPASLRAAMQVVFQDPYGSFNPRHRVGRLIAEPLHLLAEPPQGTDREKDIERALEEVGLAASDKHKFIHEFSGGQRQRIAIARALVIKPALVILDEAVSALDVSIRAQIIDLLVELRESHGLSYLFISHDLTVVRSVTERVMVMRAGQIVEQGDTADILDSPAHSYTKQLVAASPQIPADWLATGGQHGTRNIKGDA